MPSGGFSGPNQHPASPEKRVAHLKLVHFRYKRLQFVSKKDVPLIKAEHHHQTLIMKYGKKVPEKVLQTFDK